MKEILNDEKFRTLLRKKQRYEFFSWLIPLISILSLIVILVLTTKTHLTEVTIIVLVLLIFLIVGGYIFDNKLTIKIHDIYQELNDYFQNEIVPKLISSDNPTIEFSDEVVIDSKLVDEVKLFNNYTEYKSQYNYIGIMDNRKYRFHEVLFNNLVTFNTRNKKTLNHNLKKDLNYHWYNFELNKSYSDEALFLVSKFENYHSDLVKGLTSISPTFIKKINLNYNVDLELFIKDEGNIESYMKPEILEIFKDDQIVGNSIMAIYLKDNHLNIIIEEVDNLIDLTHSNKIVVESLLYGYYEEQKMIKNIVNAFDK